MLKTLSKSQSECIETINGAVMVLAGPGTGKTFTVIQRLSEMILTHKIQPESILCLTFSETAAKEMKERLEKEIAEASQGITISTYHAFCNEIIVKNSEYFKMAEDVDTIDEIVRYRIMRDIFEELEPQFLRTDKGDFYHYIKEVIAAVSEIKKTRTSKEKYFEIIETGEKFRAGLLEALAQKEEKELAGKKVTLKLLKEIDVCQKNIDRAQEIWRIFEIYTDRLKTSNYIDFDDMINFVLDVFEANPEFLQKIAAQYKYFLVDEYQDTNFAQNQLVFKLSEGSGSDNVFVVGDDDQIIYGFQGAQSDNIEKFLRQYPDSKVICLENNFRSSQNILDYSYQFISQDDCRIEFNSEFERYGISKKLTAKNEKLPNSLIKLFSFEDISQERNFIVDEIFNLINSPKCPQKDGEKNLAEIAVLVKRNSDAKDFMELLNVRGVPSQLKKNKTIFEVEASLLTIFYLKALLNADIHSDKFFGAVLCSPFGFSPSDYAFLVEEYKNSKQNFIEIIRKNPDYKWQNPEKIKRFLEIYDELKEKVSEFNLVNLIENVLEKTGILEFYSNSEINAVENLQALDTILQEAKKFQKTMKSGFLGDFTEHLDIAYNEGFEIAVSKEENRQNAVQLMTLHGSKGREFEYVFMPELLSKNWEKYRNVEKLKLPVDRVFFEPKSEHLRLLFVGMTRAKHSLCLSYPKNIGEKVVILTEYISAISKQNPLLEIQNFELTDCCVQNEKKLPQILKFDYKIHFTDQIKEIIDGLKLSPSSMDTYLKCSRGFLYSQVYKIMSKELDTKELDFGNAIHRALELAVKFAMKEGHYPSCEEMISVFEKEFNERFSKKEPKENTDNENIDKKLKRLNLIKEIFIERGKESLKKFYPYFKAIFPSKLYSAEYNLGTVLVDEMKLTGKIDKIEKNEDGTYFLTDYKTGRAYGSGKIAYEKYLDQIQFYKLAFEAKNQGDKVSHVAIVYVEAPEKTYIQQVFENDNHEIKEKIKDVFSQIQNMEFEPVCENQKNDACKWCNYKLLCKLNVI